MMCPICFYQKQEDFTIKKLKMMATTLTFEEGCNKYGELTTNFLTNEAIKEKLQNEELPIREAYEK